MTSEAFLKILVSIDFSEKYWALCDRYSSDFTNLYNGQKTDVLAAFRALNIEARYDGRDRPYAFEVGKIGEIEWSALFVKQRYSQELMISGLGPDGRLGSNLAVLAYEAKRVADTSFSRSPFSGPAPYPRPQSPTQKP